MKDPVTALDGYTYERSAIEMWFSKSDMSPMLNLKLDSKILIPNMFMRDYTEAWKRSNQGRSFQ